MAIYEFRCAKCGAEFEAMRSMSKADEPAPCPRCGGQGVKLLSVFASGESYKLRLPDKGPLRQSGAGPKK